MIIGNDGSSAQVSFSTSVIGIKRGWAQNLSNHTLGIS